MQALAEILESELRKAVEVKDDKSLHRYVALLSENVISRQSHSEHYSELKDENRQILIEMREGFKRMDERFYSMQKQMDERFSAVDRRFDDVNKRFDDVNRKFDMQFRFTTIGFVILGLVTTLLKVV